MSDLKIFQFVGFAGINTSHAVITGGLVMGFRIVKEWIVKHKENQILIKLKIARELQLQKARIYPRFLFQSLYNLQVKMSSSETDSPDMILKLSELLSYLLYESDEESIPLERELVMTTNLLHIEGINQAQHLTLSSKVTTNTADKFVRPMVLFSVLRNCLEIMSMGKEHFTVDFAVETNNQMLHVNIVINPVSKRSNVMEGHQILNKIEQRMYEFCKNGYDLKLEGDSTSRRIIMGIALS